MNFRHLKGWGLSLACCLSILLALPAISLAGQWINPKDAIGDPMLARLQHGKTELTEVEKQEIEKYGYTGLEVMTYLYDNLHPGQDWSNFHSCVNVDTFKNISVGDFLVQQKYNYKDMKQRLTNDGIKPGDVDYKSCNLILTPPESKGRSMISINYLRDKMGINDMDGWSWSKQTRKVTRGITWSNLTEERGTMVDTRDDSQVREPWEEVHRIIGEDTVTSYGKDYECFVIESKHKDPTYYLSKRVTWVEKNNFINPHEEQFNREGKLFKIFYQDWFQLESNKYWVSRETNIIKLPSKRRTLHRTPIWIMDQGLDDKLFTRRMMGRYTPWIETNGVFPPVKSLSDLTPEPEVRWEFWQKMGINIEVAK